MNTVLQWAGAGANRPNFKASLAWSWADQAWGYCREFEELGMTALVLGPVHIQFEWDVV